MRAFIFALREFRTFIVDKADLTFALLLPIVTFALMYGAFSGQNRFNGTAYIVDGDKGVYSQQIIQRLKTVDGLAVKQVTALKADRMLEQASLLLALYIPDDFSQKLTSGEPAQLLFKQRGNGGQEGQIVVSIVNGIAQDISQEFQVRMEVIRALAGSGIPQSAIIATVDRNLTQERSSPSIDIKRDVVGTQTDPVLLYLFGIITMYAMFAVTANARAVVEERQKGTLERLMTTRLTIGELFFGKFMANMARGFVQILILMILAYAVFQIFTPLSFIQGLVIAIIFTASVSSIGLFIASIVRTADQSTWLAVFLTMAMVMLGGTFFKAAPGSIFAMLSKFSVNTYANNAFETVVVRGNSLTDIGFELLVMAVAAVVCLFISRLMFRVMPGGK